MMRLVFVATLLCGATCFAEDVKLAPRHVSVTGTAVVRAQPDVVVWHVQVRRTNKELAKAHSECDEGVKRVLRLRDELKLNVEDVQTGHLSVQKIFDRDSAGNHTSFRHFQVNRSITLRQHDTTTFDHVLARLMDASDIEVSHSLESSRYHELRQQTRLEAVKAARQKAAAMTELLGGKLGRVLRIEEPVERFGGAGLALSNMAYAGPRQAEADQAPGTFAPGSIEIRVSIEVSFEIE